MDNPNTNGSRTSIESEVGGSFSTFRRSLKQRIPFGTRRDTYADVIATPRVTRRHLPPNRECEIADEEWCWRPASSLQQQTAVPQSPVNRGRLASKVPMHSYLYAASDAGRVPGQLPPAPSPQLQRQSSLRRSSTKIKQWPPSRSAMLERENLIMINGNMNSRPPSAADAAEDINAHVRRLNVGRGSSSSCTNTPLLRQRKQHFVRNGSSRGSQQSLMSLMSSIAGTSVFGASPHINRKHKDQMKPTTSSNASSRSSYCEYNNMAVKSGGSGVTRRSMPSYTSGRYQVQRHSAVSTNTSVSVSACVRNAPDGLTIRPLFLTLPHHPTSMNSVPQSQSTFIGREWLFRELSDSLLNIEQTGSRVCVIHGAAGVGKTAICTQLASHSSLFTQSDTSNDARGSADSGCYLSNSRMSLDRNNQLTTGQSNTDWLRHVAKRVLTVHCCRIEHRTTCTLVHFICNMAAQLACQPVLRAYAELLVQDTNLQNMLDLKQALQCDPLHLFREAIVCPLQNIQTPEGAPYIFMIDALDEAEFHKAESASSLASFMRDHSGELPDWCRWIVTVRGDQLSTLDKMCGTRRIALDDAVLDERVLLDTHAYVDWRLSQSFDLQQQVAQVTGAADTEDMFLHFIRHMVNTAHGNMLYLQLTLQLIQERQLQLRTTSYSSLPVNLSEVFLLMFNLRYQSSRAFDRVSPILSVLMATLQPMNTNQLLHCLNAGRTNSPVSKNELTERLDQLSEFVVEQSDGTVALFHSAFRYWLMRRSDGHSAKFFADVRQGHMLLALSMSRRGQLNPDELIELGHHILKAHAYKHLRTNADNQPQALDGADGRDCQLLWVQQAAADLSNALCSRTNIVTPNTKVTRLLLLAGANANAVLDDGTPLLCLAASMGQTELCSLLMEFHASVDGVCAQDACSPLMCAARAGHLDVVQMLHQNTATLALQDSKERTALVHAAESGHVPVVSFLLQCDWAQHTHTQNTHRQRSLHHAFVVAATANQLKVCQFLHEMCDVPVCCLCPASERTALSSSARAGHSEIVRYLLQSGASVRAVQGESDTPLLAAVAGGSWEIVSLLLARGLDVEQEADAEQNTPLMAAAQHGHIGVMELLLSRGASVSAHDKNGRTALHRACASQQMACAALLLDRGCPVNMQDAKQQTALHTASRYADKRMVQLLIDRGANMDSVDMNEQRPIDLSVAHNNLSSLSCFLRRGAKLSSTTWQLATGNLNIGCLLLQKLIEDGTLLYRRNRLKDSQLRFEYAQRKLAHIQLEHADADGDRSRLRILTFNILVGLGKCKRRHGQFNEAIDCCDDALQLGPATMASGGFEAYLLRAKCHFDTQNISAALSDAQTAAKLAPNNRDAAELLASLHSSPSQTRNNQHNQLHLDTAGQMPAKTHSPADCSSDSGNQHDFDEPHTLSPSNRSCETEL